MFPLPPCACHGFHPETLLEEGDGLATLPYSQHLQKDVGSTQSKQQTNFDSWKNTLVSLKRSLIVS